MIKYIRYISGYNRFLDYFSIYTIETKSSNNIKQRFGSAAP
jgi:hypothetical protein